jgi:hypothetical protein
VLRSLSIHALLCTAPPVSGPADLPAPPSSGDADALPVDLRWDAPEGCPPREAVLEDLQRLTGGEVDPSAPNVVVVDAAIVREDGGYTLRLGARALHDLDCDLLAKAAALMVAVDIAPIATAQRVGVGAPAMQVQPPADVTREPVDVTPVREPIVASPPRTAARPAPRARTAWTHRFLAAANGGLALGIVPGISGSVGGRVGWGFGPLRLEVVGLHTIRRTDEVIDGASIRASSSGGGVHVLYAPTAGPIVPMLGAGFEAGVLAGRGLGDAVQPRPVRAAWTAVALVVGLAWPAEGRIALRAGAEALVTTLRPGLHLQSVAGEAVPAFRVPPAGLRVMIGPEIRLP